MSSDKKIPVWELRQTHIPHQPFQIVDEFEEMVCTVFQSKRDIDNAVTIQNIPRLRKLLSMVCDYADAINNNDVYPLEEDLFDLAKKIEKNKF